MMPVLLDGPAWLEALKAKGWSPVDRLIAYQEARQWLRPSITPSSSAALDITRAMQERLAQAMQQFDTPDDLERYRKHWPALALGKARWEDLTPHTPPEVLTGEASRALIQALETTDMAERSEAIHRCTTFAFRHPAWDDLREVGLEEAELDEVLALERWRPASHALPEGWTSTQAWDHLVEAVQEAGLRQLSWPTFLPATAEQWFALGEDVRLANAELAQQTGFKGPALGLHGRTALSLGVETLAVDGNCSFEATPIIRTSPSASWSPVSHEWLHALDAVMGAELHLRDGITSANTPLNEEASAWQALLHDLVQPALSEEEQHQLKTFAVNDALARWPEASAVHQAMRRWLEDLQNPQWDRAHILETLVDAQRADDRVADETITVARAHMKLAELMLVHQYVHRDRVGSPWNDLASQYRAEMQQHPSKEVRSYAGYLQDPAEQVAHSFESTFSTAAMTSNVSTMTSLRYPQGLERQHHTLAWKRLFRALGPWWQRQQPTPAPAADAPLSWAARLAERRAAKLDATPSSPSRPVYP